MRSTVQLDHLPQMRRSTAKPAPCPTANSGHIPLVRYEPSQRPYCRLTWVATAMRV